MDQFTLLQLAIRSLGISGLGIRIDKDRDVIVATYSQGGADHTKEITFAALERMFTQGPIKAQTDAPHNFSTPVGR